jgi:hypothetical protein
VVVAEPIVIHAAPAIAIDKGLILTTTNLLALMNE